MIVRWVASPFDVPIFDAAYDVARVGRTQHDFHFEAGVVFTVGKQHVNSSVAALDPFHAQAHPVLQALELRDRR